MPRRNLPIYIGVFLISTATLVLEISLTRIFSVAQWYHFAFMVISIALFGIGASGSFLSVFPSLLKKDTPKLLAISSTIFSISCIICFAITNQVPFDPFRIAWDRMQLFYLLLYYILLAVPFFFSGLCIAVVLSKMAKRVSRIYFSDLVGAGSGCLLVIALFSPLQGEAVVLFASLLGAVSAFFFSLNFSKKGSYLTVVWIVVVLLLLSNVPSILQMNISPYKSLNVALRYPDAELLYTEWNAFSRVDVVKSPYVRYAPGLSYEYRRAIPPQRGTTVDANALSAITRYDGTPASIEFTGSLPMSLAYQLQKEPGVLILGSGGGLDVLTALYHNASSIVAVEINPIVVDLVKNKYREFSGNIYENEKVSVEISEGRSFVRSSSEKYDVIQLSLIDNIAASSTGVYALSENYLYTTEAFEDYYAHLSDNGVLSITRWLHPPPRESVRVVSLALAALENRGVEDPENHIAAIRSWGTITILVKKNGFTPQDKEKIKGFCRERKFDLVYAPGITPADVNIYNKFPEPYYYQMFHGLLLSEDRAKFYDEYLFDVSPVTDERPFFFHFFKIDKIVPTYNIMGEKWQPFIEGGYLVPVVFLQALILSLLFIFLPVYRFKRTKKTILGKWKMLTYFLCLGIGYMFIEIALIQKFILFLGHPVYAVSTVLFTLLVFSGIGSLFTERFEIRAKILVPVIVGLSVLVIIYMIFLPYFFHIFLGQDLLARRLISLICIAPLGFIMGMPFPVGIRLADAIDPDLIPWAFAANGCASVLSSISAVMIALSFGFSSVLALAGLVYLAGLGMILSLDRKEGFSL